MATNIAVTQGEYIGILGWRGTTNSYGSGPHNTSIDGHQVTLNRMGMQYNLNTTPAQDLWTESSYISRVEMYYTVGLTVTTSNPLPTAAEGTPYSHTIEADHGTTPYTWTTNITGLPQGLSASMNGDDLEISGTPSSNPSSVGNYQFTVDVTDAANETAQKTFDLSVVPPPTPAPFVDTFSSPTGWQVSSPWAIAPAQAYSASNPTRSEPGDDYTPGNNDDMILGDTIGGDFAINDGTTYWATSPQIDCSSISNVRLAFRRWLGCSIGTDASIEVSNNGGVSWDSVWSSTSGSSQTTIRDTSWTSMQYDITQWAAGHSVVQIRFGIGPTGGTSHTGWCIDDFRVEEPGPELLIYEGSPNGTQIQDDDPVGGLRDFGQQPLSTNTTVTFEIENAGPADITFQSWTKTGADPSQFILQAGNVPNPLPSGQSATFDITFHPTSTGVKTATLEIDHDAQGSGTTPFEINLRGEGTQQDPDMIVYETTAGGTSVAHQEPAAGTIRDFGQQDTAAGPTAPITIVIENDGNADLLVNEIVMDETVAGSGDFAHFDLIFPGSPPSSGSPITIAGGGGTYDFEVEFNPTSTGVKDAFVRIQHSDSNKDQPYHVMVLGEGVAAQPGFAAFEGGAGGTALTHDATASGGRDFGQQDINAGPTSTQTFTIENTGSQSVDVSTPVLGGADPGHFVLDTSNFTSNPMSLAAGATIDFTVAFDPNNVGVKDATVEVAHTAPNPTSPFIINVTGEGVLLAPDIEVRETDQNGSALSNPASATGILDFGTQDVYGGASAAAVIYIENTGTAPLNLGMPTFNPSTTEFQLQTGSYATSPLAVGASTSFGIVFDPTSTGVKDAMVEFSHNAGGLSSPFILNVTGEGINNSPTIEVREGSVTGTVVASGDPVSAGGGRDLGSIDVGAGATGPVTIVIINTGNQDLDLSGGLSLTGPNAGAFALDTGGMASSLSTGGNTSFDVTFDPTLGGIKDAQVEISHNDPSLSTEFILPVQGTAVDPNGVQITTSSLPEGSSGTTYPDTQLQATQGSTPYTWSVYAGTLPAGLTLDASGLLSGTPTSVNSAVHDVTLRVTDQTGATHERQYSIIIYGSSIVSHGGGGAKTPGCAANTSSSWALLLGVLGTLAVAGVMRRRRA